METAYLIQTLQGPYIIEDIITKLKVTRQTAIKYVSALRKKGYVKTEYLKGNKRLYRIGMENQSRGTSYYDVLNKNSPIKLHDPNPYRIYGRKITLEETLIYAIKTKEVRPILAAIALYKKIHNWKRLYTIAKESSVEQEVGALYDLAREIIKTRKMPKRFRRFLARNIKHRHKYIIDNFQSKDYKKIEDTWKVRIPFNKNDFEDYKSYQ